MIVADDAFPLKTYLLKPYPFRGVPLEKRVTDYRISRPRRVSENAFGILGNRSEILLSAMKLSPENAEKVTLASCVLHKFLREKSPARYTPLGSFDTEDIETGDVQEGDWKSSRNLSAIRHPSVSGRNLFSFFYDFFVQGR